MYPHRELTGLAVHKAELQQRIVLRRASCMASAAQAARPLELLDRAAKLWRQLSVLTGVAVIPLGALVGRAVFSRRKLLDPIRRWGPLAVATARAAAAVISPMPRVSCRRSR